MVVYDHVLPDPHAYRAEALLHPFEDITVDGVTFHGIAKMSGLPLLEWLAERHPALKPTLSFLRKSPEGQQEPHYIHTDVDMGDVTVILYLTDPPKVGDGTCFWKHKACGATSGGLVPTALGHDREQWSCWRMVPAAFNRAVIFDAALFHSRAIAENYGEGDEARLIQVVFGEWER